MPIIHQNMIIKLTTNGMNDVGPLPWKPWKSTQPRVPLFVVVKWFFWFNDIFQV